MTEAELKIKVKKLRVENRKLKKLLSDAADEIPDFTDGRNDRLMDRIGRALVPQK